MPAVESTIIGAVDEHAGHDNWSETHAGLVELNARLLAKTARAPDGIRPM